MNTAKMLPTAAPLRWVLATLLVAVAATAAQTASAQPHGMRAGAEQRHGGDAMGMGMGMGMGMASPHMLGRMLDTVNASAEQRAQIKQIIDAARADMKAQHEGGRKLREDGAALFTQPTVDARAAETLRQQMLARHDQASKRQLQVMLDISRVLTPEQRKTLADKMAQRRSMMERHRAERAAADNRPGL